MKNKKAITEAWEYLGTLRNQVKERVKQVMGWKGDVPFYDRVYGRVACTPAEQEAFEKAFADLKLEVKDIFPEDESLPVTVE